MSGDRVTVPKLPACDLCQQSGLSKPAYYDGKTHMGPWAFMCKTHFSLVGVGLGVGRGQELIVEESND